VLVGCGTAQSWDLCAMAKFAQRIPVGWTFSHSIRTVLMHSTMIYCLLTFCLLQICRFHCTPSQTNDKDCAHQSFERTILLLHLHVPSWELSPSKLAVWNRGLPSSDTCSLLVSNTGGCWSPPNGTNRPVTVGRQRTGIPR
jgi:hypothetical protein